MKRREFLLASVAGLTLAGRGRAASRQQLGTKRPVPSASQLDWQREELALFLHFGVNTFTDREWGEGKEDPAIFNPTTLDARQWAKAARAGGFKMMILTAKHHDGFCLWPTKTTKHSVASSPFRGGKGDVVREFVDGCRAERLRTGVYLSPWDRNHPTYGDSPRYNDVYCDQLTELLTQYGPMAEVWFDGANGEGPNGKRQVYDWPRVWGLVKKLQPESVIFSDAGPDVRWCGNERGVAGDPNWSTVDPSKVPYPGVSGPGITEALQHGDRDGTVWRPAEADVSIRRGWFYHPAQDATVKTVDQLVDLYFSSVGRNSKLLLNVPPTKDGLLHETDVARLSGMRERLGQLFAEDLTQHVKAESVGFTTSSQKEIDFGRDTTISIVRLAEDLALGQAVERYRVLGSGAGNEWQVLSSGTTIGYAKIDRLGPATVRRLRVIAEGGAPLSPVSVGVF
jgi:alpha-L-fucosidase